MCVGLVAACSGEAKQGPAKSPPAKPVGPVAVADAGAPARAAAPPFRGFAARPPAAAPVREGRTALAERDFKVHVVGDDPKLTPVAFELTALKKLETYESSASLFPARAATGELAVLTAGGQMLVWSGAGLGERAEFDVRGGVGATLQELAGRSMSVRELFGFQTDARGNLLFGAVGHYDGMYDDRGFQHLRYPAHLAFAGTEPALVAWESFAAQFGDADRPLGEEWKVRLAPGGDGAWLIVTGALYETQTRHRVFWLVPSGRGAWTATEIVPRLRKAEGLAAPEAADLAWGAPDWSGGWVFWSSGAFWRLDRDGEAKPLVKMRLPKGLAGDPIVLENGDLWFATNADGSSRVNVDDGGNVTGGDFYVSGRSRWVRVRRTSRGVSLGEISEESLVAAFARAGVGGITTMETIHPSVDHAGGGVVALNASGDVVYALRATD